MKINKKVLEKYSKSLRIFVVVLLIPFSGFSQIMEIQSVYHRTTDCRFMFDVIFQGGMEPYSVQIEGPDTSIYYASVSGGGNTLDVIEIVDRPGVYSINVNDDNGNNGFAIVDIESPTNIQFSSSIKNSCNGLSNGDIVNTIGSYTNDLHQQHNLFNGITYTWTTNNGAGLIQGNKDQDNLSIGNYTLNVSTGCNDTNIIREFQVEEDSMLVVFDTVTNASSGICNGLIDVHIVGNPVTTLNIRYVLRADSNDYFYLNEPISNLCYNNYQFSIYGENHNCYIDTVFDIGIQEIESQILVDTIQLSIDTCIFNTLPVDSAFIYDYTIINSDSVLLKWIFWQNEDSILFDIGVLYSEIGETLIDLEISCNDNNKSVNSTIIYKFYGFFNAISTTKQEINNISIIKVFPNPTNDFVNIEFDSKQNTISTISIIDLSGKVLITKKIADNIQLNTKGLKNGIYMLKIEINNNVITKKIIIE